MKSAKTPRHPNLVGALRRDRATLLRGTALTATFLLVVSLPAAAQPAPNARPTGGTVVGGSVAINQSSATNTQVTQTTQRGAVDWKTFDLGSSQSVTFAQPGASAITLNRVTTPNPSQIAGQITANGQIVIVNQSGVVFFPGSQVNAQSLVVSAAGIDPKKFMAGSLAFNQAARPGARIVNAGTLTAGKAGLVGLVAPSVANSGVITAKLGHVVLAGAEAHTLDMYGDGLISIDITKQVTSVPLGPDGKPVAALVTNSGLIRADGGTVQLTAAAADGLVQTLVTAGGTISARTTQGSVGSISIAGTGGSVTVDGALLANGRGAGQTGGQIAVNATGDVTIANGARIAANGRAGGGAIALGTTLARAMGGSSVTPSLTARHTTVAKGATISANATENGQGGTIAVLSTDLTTMRGAITAKGGPKGGDGGAVEISGGAIQLGGTVDVSAARGATGVILLDPEDLTIATDGGAGINPGTNDPNIPYGQGGVIGGSDYFVTPAQLVALNGNVHLQAARSLVVANSFAITAGGVTLEAGSNLFVNPGVTISSPNSISLSAATNFGGTTTVQGYNAGATLSVLGSLSGSSIFLTGGDGGVVLGAGAINATNQLSITTTGPITEAALGVVSSNSVNFSASSISLPGPNNIGTIFGASAGIGDILIANAPGNGITTGPSLLVLGQISVPTSGTITLIADGMTFLDGFVNAPLGTIILAPASAGYGVEVIASGTPSTNTLSLNYNQLSQSISASTLELGTAQKLVGPINFGNTGDTIDLTNVQNGGGDGSSGALNLGVYSTGAVTSNGTLLVGSLFGQANSVNINTAGGQIATIGSLTATGDITLFSNEPTTVAGPLTSTTGNIQFEALGSITLAGNVTGAAVLINSDDLGGQIASAINQTAGSITAASLNASASNGTVSLPGANQITTLTELYGGGGSAYLNNATSLIISDTGVYSSTTINVAGSIAVTGSVTSAATFSDLTLLATGAITQTGTGALIVSDLTASGTSVSLPSATNAVGVILSGSASTGDFTITDSIPLTVSGTISITGPSTIAITDDTLTITNGGGTPGLGGFLLAAAGTVALAPLTANQPYSVYATQGVPAGQSGFSLAEESGLISTIVLALGSPTTGPIALAPDGAGLDFGAHGVLYLALTSNGAVTQGANAPLSVNSIFGTANSVTLLAANTITATQGFTTTNGFALNDTTQFSVNGALSDQATLSLNATGGIQINNPIYANILQLGTAGPGAVIQNSSSITATTLNAIGSTVSLPATFNSVVNLGSVAATTSFLLHDSQPLTVAGTVSAPALTLTVAGGLTINAPLSGGTVTLEPTGTISEGVGGSVGATTLLGSATTASFAQPGNAVLTLGSFATTTGLTLVNGTSLTVSGPVTDSASIVLSSLGALTVTGNVTAPSVSLTASNFVVNTVTIGNGDIRQTGGAISAAATIALDAQGQINQTGGSIIGGGLLTGSAGTNATLTSSGNLIGALGAFTASGNLLLVDGEALSVTGLTSANLSTGTLSLTTTVGGMTLSGQLQSDLVNLVSAGPLVQTGGTVIATSLTGSGAGINLSQTTNQISGVGGLASTGSLYLVDSSAVSLNGPISAGAGTVLTVIDDAPQIAGSLSAGATGTIVIAPLTAGAGFTIASGAGDLFNAANPQAITAKLFIIGSAAAGPINVAGSITLPNVGTLDLLSAGAVSGNGALSVGTLIGNAATFDLENTDPTATSSVATLGPVTAAGGVTFVDGTGLTVSGPINGAAGIFLQAGANGAAGGTLALTGALVTTGTAQFIASGDITQPSGSISAATMLATSTGGAASFNAPTNAIGTLSTSSATSFSLADSTSLVVGGVLSSITGTISLSAGPLTINGEVLSATGLTLVSTGAITETPQSGDAGGYVQTGGPMTGSATSLALNQSLNAVNSIGSFTTTGGFTLDNQALTVSGPVTAGTTLALDISGALALAGNLGAPTIAISVVNAGTLPGNVSQTGGTVDASAALSLTASGSFAQTGGALVSPSLSGGTGLSFNAVGTSNLIGAIGSFSSVGGFTLIDSEQLGVSGSLTDTASIALTTSGGLTLSGVVNAPTIALTASGPITQSGGSLVATLLTGDASGVTLGSPANAVTTIGNFASSGNFLFADTGSLTVSGTISAATGGTLTLANDALAFTATAALVAPGGTVVLAPLTAGDAITLGGGGGVAGTSQVTANTLVVGSPTAGAITIAGAFNLAQVPTLDLVSAALVSETGAGALAVNTLIGAAQGGLSLTGANQIQKLGAITSAGSIAIADAAAVTLTGTISAPGQQIVLNADTVSFATGALLSVGTTGPAATSGVFLLPYLNGDAMSVTGNAGTAQIVSANLVGIGGPVAGAGTSVLTTGSLLLAGSLNLGGASVVLASKGAIAEAANGAIDAATLSVSQGTSVNLAPTGAANGIGTLGVVATTGGFGLSNATALTVAGPVNDSVSVSLISGNGLTLTGVIGAPTVSLSSAGAVTQTGGTLTATTLSVTGLGVSLGQATNRFGTLGASSSGANLLVADATPLTVGGAVSVVAGGTLTLSDDSIAFGPAAQLVATGGTVALQPLTAGDAISIGGPSAFGANAPVTANVLLIGDATSGAITVTGQFNLANVPTLDLLSAGAITEANGAGVSVGTLIGGGASLSFGGANTIATLGAFTTPGVLTLNDGVALSVIGPVTATGGATLNVGGALALAGNVTTSGTANLISSSTITQTAGSLTASTLTNLAISTSLNSPTNAVGTLSVSTDATNFTLVDNIGLIVTGAVDPATVNMTVNGPLTIAAPITATTSVSLAATGAITEIAGGSVTTPLLTGSAASASFAQGDDAVSTLGTFATSGGFTLINDTALTVAGPVSDGASIFLRSLGTLTAAGNIIAPSVTLIAQSATTTLPGTDAAVVGATITGRGDILQTGGTIVGANSVTLLADGLISQSPGQSIVTGALSGSAGLTTSLQNTNNLIAALDSFSSNGGFALSNAEALAVNGPVTDSVSVSISTLAGLTLNGVVSAPSVSLTALNGAITQPGGNLTASNLSAFGSSVTLGRSTNSIGTLVAATASANAGSLLIADGAALTVGGTASAPSGNITLAADTITFGPSAQLSAPSGTVTLQPLTTGDAITLGGPASFAANAAVTAQVLAIGAANAGSITITGALNVSGAPTLALLSGGQVSETGAGAIQVGALQGSAAGGFSLLGANQIGTLGNLSSVTHVIDIADAAPVTIAGTISAPGEQIAIFADSIAFASGGLLDVGTSTAATTANAFLNGNQADIFLVPYANGDPLLVSGANGVSGAAVTNANLVLIGRRRSLDTGSLTVAGSLTISGGLNLGATSAVLTSAGAISETGAGGIATGTLSVNSANTTTTDITLTGANLVSTLSNVTASGSFSLTDGKPLTIVGPLSAPTIAIRALGSLTLAGGTVATNTATFQVLAPAFASAATNGPTTTTTFTPTLSQTGTTTFSLLNGTSGQLALIVPDGGLIQLANLQAPSFATTLNTGAGGTSFGNLTVGALNVIGSGGTADLAGVVGGATGFDAAVASRISPAFDVNYQINGCPIMSVTCTTTIVNPMQPIFQFPPSLIFNEFTSTFLRPDLITLDLLTLAIAPDPDDPEEVLPNISRRDN